MNKQKALVSLKAFLKDDQSFIKIIDVCDLQIKDDWRHWIDCSGNTISLTQEKHFHSSKSSIENYTDIYFKSHPKTIALKSNWAMFSITENDDFFIWFLGNDNKLRVCCYIENQWLENKPPLTCGINTLKIVVNHFDVKDYTVIFGQSITGPIEGKVVKTWITEWPPSDNFKIDLLLTNRNIGQKLLGELI